MDQVDNAVDTAFKEKKRPLKDVINNFDHLSYPKGRSKDLQKEIRQLSTNENMTSVPFKTNIPIPSNISYLKKKEIDRSSSNIPIPSKSKNLNLDVERLHKLIDVKRGLSKKIDRSNPQNDYSFDYSEPPIIARADDGIAKSQVQRLAALEVERAGLLSKIEESELSVIDLKRKMRKISNNIFELRSEYAAERKQFEFLEESVMKNVLNKEKLINIQIKEFNNVLVKEYNDLSFELKNELLNAQDFNDQELQQEITKLKNDLNALRKSLNDAREHKAEVLNRESLALEKDLELFLNKKTKEVDQLTVSFAAEQSKLDASVASKKKTEFEIENKMKELASLKDQLSSVNSEGSNYALKKSELVFLLNKEEESLSHLEERDLDFDKAIVDVERSYAEYSARVEQDEKQRKILENSIMDLENQTRVYVKLPKTAKISSSKSFSIQDNSFNVSKCFDCNSSNHSIFAEFEMLNSNPVYGMNVSVLISGVGSAKLMTDYLVMSYASLQKEIKQAEKVATDSSIFLQIISLNDGVFDVLDNMKESHLEKGCDLQHITKIKITSSISLIEILTNLESKQNNLKLFVFRIEGNIRSGKKVINSILFLSLFDLKLKEQSILLNSMSRLSLDDGPVANILQYCTSDTKILNLQLLDHISNDDAIKLLESIP